MVEKTMPLDMVIIRELELYVVAVYVKQSGNASSGLIGDPYTVLVVVHLMCEGICLHITDSYFCFPVVNALCF
jgi:hypothetical protein